MLCMTRLTVRRGEHLGYIASGFTFALASAFVGWQEANVRQVYVVRHLEVVAGEGGVRVCSRECMMLVGNQVRARVSVRVWVSV